MSWMFTRPEGLDWFVNLRPTMLDDPSWFVPFIETFTEEEKLAWATMPAVHSYGRFPPFDAYEGLTKEYAKWAEKARNGRANAFGRCDGKGGIRQ